MSDFGKKLSNVTADLLSNSDFINRSVGMANSYEDIMFIVQALGREPISLSLTMLEEIITWVQTL